MEVAKVLRFGYKRQGESRILFGARIHADLAHVGVWDVATTLERIEKGKERKEKRF